MSIFQVKNGQLQRKDVSAAEQLLAVDTDNILGGGAGADTDAQALFDGLADGIRSSDAAISAIVNVYGSKNLLKNEAYSQTINGIAFTVYGDGSVKANGTASAIAVLDLCVNPALCDNQMILNGCPAGGGSSTYEINYSNNVDNAYRDYGGGTAKFSKFNSSTYPTNKVSIVIRSGVTVSNLMFYPMIRDARIKDSTYVPCVPANRDLVPWSANALYGVHNILPKSGYTIATQNNASLTLADGLHAFDVTCTSDNFSGAILRGNSYGIKDITEKLGITGKALRVTFQFKASAAAQCKVGVESDPGREMTVPTSWTKYEYIDVYQSTDSGSYANVVFYNISGSALTINVKDFCISLAEDTDETYQPYAMTNQQLTEGVAAFFSLSNDGYTGDLNDLTTGIMYCSSSATNNPIAKWGYCITLKKSGSNIVQFFAGQTGNGVSYRRCYNNGGVATWDAWKAVTLS